MSPTVLDRFRRCAACGRRDDCCGDCHRGHDHAWRRFLATPGNSRYDSTINDAVDDLLSRPQATGIERGLRYR